MRAALLNLAENLESGRSGVFYPRDFALPVGQLWGDVA